jgi:hypothetical protein
MAEALNPSPAVLAKIGSIVVHVDEALSPDGHSFDFTALRALIADPEVQDWLTGMSAMALVPRKRKG